VLECLSIGNVQNVNSQFKTHYKTTMCRLTYFSLVILIFFISETCYCQGQNDSIDERYNFSDTIKFSKASFYKVKSLDCFSYQYIDTIDNNFFTFKILLAGSPIIIARKVDNEYFISQFEIEGNPYFDKPELINFSGTGYSQLLLKWHSNVGSSDFYGNGGNASSEEGFIIIDLEENEIVANFTTYRYDATWWSGSSADEIDTIEAGGQILIESGETEDCFNFIPEIKLKEITLTQSSCDKKGENASDVFDKPLIIKYKLLKGALVKITSN